MEMDRVLSIISEISKCFGSKCKSVAIEKEDKEINDLEDLVTQFNVCRQRMFIVTYVYPFCAHFSTYIDHVCIDVCLSKHRSS